MQRISLLLAAGVLALGACGSTTAPPAPAPSPAPAPAPKQEAAAGFDWPLPDGWKGETIPFPLGFAPDLPYRGVEELRFPPGFFDPDSSHFWSYAFVWMIEPPIPDVTALERDLPAYFAGLARAVSEGRHDLAQVGFTAAIDGDESTGFTGTAVAFDAFTTGRTLTLHLRATATPCPTSGQSALIVLLSPRPPAEDDSVWKDLESVAAGFRCR
jgi:hypothetical protein